MTNIAVRYLATLLVLCSVASLAYSSGRLVLVVDDLGNQFQPAVNVINNPLVSTVAIMPGRPFTDEIANLANQHGKEIIVHLPMANETDFPLGPLGLNADDSSELMLQTLRSAIHSVPHAVGLSNHMGSRLTQDETAMRILVRELKQQGLYFFDSRTIASTVAWKVAKEEQVPWSMRNVFLDHQRDQEFMAKQWHVALTRVNRGEDTTVIAHPYPETLEFLDRQWSNGDKTLSLGALSSVLNYPNYPVRSTVKSAGRSERNFPDRP